MKKKNIIALEDIATVFISEFVKANKLNLQYYYNNSDCLRIPFLKMDFAQRRKLVEKVLDKLLE